MLTKFDDYPIHQTSEPLAIVATTDRHAYDRYWFNGYQDDGAFYFGIGAAVYPNLGHRGLRALSIVHDGEQHAFHGFAPRGRRAERDRGRALPDRDHRADEEPAGHARRERHGHLR